MVFGRSVVYADEIKGAVIGLTRDRSRKTHEKVIATKSIDVEKREIQPDETLADVDSVLAS